MHILKQLEALLLIVVVHLAQDVQFLHKEIMFHNAVMRDENADAIQCGTDTLEAGKGLGRPTKKAVGRKNWPVNDEQLENGRNRNARITWAFPPQMDQLDARHHA